MTIGSLSCTSSGAGIPPHLPSVDSVLGRAGGENFTVASHLLPRPSRDYLVAFYGFARLTDEIGDSYAGDRLAALDWLEQATVAALAGRPAGHPLVERAAAAVVRLGIDPAPLFDLIAANRRDQQQVAYPRFDDLVSYCRQSADPVGRLVLAAFGYRDPALVAWSDALCTGLQLVEHCQDVREDALAGRVYIPAEDLERFGVSRSDLTRAAPAPARQRALMVFEVARARGWLERGRPLVAAIAGRPRWAVAGFLAGGHAALDGLARRDFDVLVAPARPARRRVAVHLLRALTPTRGAA